MNPSDYSNSVEEDKFWNNLLTETRGPGTASHRELLRDKERARKNDSLWDRDELEGYGNNRNNYKGY